MLEDEYEEGEITNSFGDSRNGLLSRQDADVISVLHKSVVSTAGEV